MTDSERAGSRSADLGTCRCGGRLARVPVELDEGERLYACERCGATAGYRRLPADEPMPSERGMPARELLDDPGAEEAGP